MGPSAFDRPTGLFRTCRLPLLLSLGVHGLLVLVLYLAPAVEMRDDRPLLVDTCVFADPPMTLSLGSPRPARAEPAVPLTMPITVGDLPTNSAPPAAGPVPGAGPSTGASDGSPGGNGAGRPAAWTEE